LARRRPYRGGDGARRCRANRPGDPRRIALPGGSDGGRLRKPAPLRDEGKKDSPHRHQEHEERRTGRQTMRMRQRPWVSPFNPFAFSLLCVLYFLVAEVSAGDWLHWRGPEQNGVSREKDLPDTWNEIWKAPVGCRSTPLIQGNRVYIINAVGEGQTAGERVMCFDADTGKVNWEHRFGVFFADIDISRVGWTTLAGDPETGNIYTHGTQGFLTCFSKDGKILWQHSLIEEYGRGGGYGGRFPSPIVDGDLV